MALSREHGEVTEPAARRPDSSERMHQSVPHTPDKVVNPLGTVQARGYPIH